jgi:hypothetical protein
MQELLNLVVFWYAVKSGLVNVFVFHLPAADTNALNWWLSGVIAP